MALLALLVATRSRDNLSLGDTILDHSQLPTQMAMPKPTQPHGALCWLVQRFLLPLLATSCFKYPQHFCDHLVVAI